MDDDQLGFDIEFDAKTTAFLEWVAPERMEAQIRAFLTDTVPGIADYTDTWWKPPLTKRVLEAAHEYFGDRETFFSPEYRSAADQFIRFYGECFVRRAGMRWTNEHGAASPPLYPDFCPVISDDEGLDTRHMVEMTRYLFGENLGPDIAEYDIAATARDQRKMR
ncbi:hypothetical protein [Nocardia farcinica]|uniref:hypothetical protein n=1 Tax=Nocardia farcinica TaxID=37329 RepID=UPI001895B65A|nr:hypothetical protein [Nocardia farcinica]MBF6071694.1 hypothetical protein [Nocardia farcinica]